VAVDSPVIGISSYSEVARWGRWDQRATLLPQTYVDQVSAAGGVPVLLPPTEGIAGAIGRLDGLILSGGPDVAAERYGQQSGPLTVTRPDRDAAELALFRAALDARLPVLGICRGMQLMNVALGGTLIQHLPDVYGHDGHSSPEAGAHGEHKVTIGESGRLAGIFGPGLAAVPTHHHQGIDQLADGLTATAWAQDGLIEAFELDPVVSPLVIGVQWHPEAGRQQALFRALIEAAGA
jgi:gamma-glutamyl-gamma-aminobutyrate hydrolase PuuD